MNMLLQTTRELQNKTMVSEVEKSTRDRCLRLLVDTLHAVCKKCLELCDKVEQIGNLTCFLLAPDSFDVCIGRES